MGQLQRILAAEEEPVEAEPEALEALARAADGSMRDALSLCDQAIAHGGGQLAASQLRELLGTVGQDRVWALLEALQLGDGAALLAEVEQLAALCPNYRNLLVELLACLHRIAVEQAVPGSGDSRYADWAKRLDPETVQLFYQAGVIGRRDFELAPNPRCALEMSLLRMLSFRLPPTASTAVASPASSTPAADASSAAPATGKDSGAGAQASAPPPSPDTASTAPKSTPEHDQLPVAKQVDEPVEEPVEEHSPEPAAAEPATAKTPASEPLPPPATPPPASAVESGQAGEWPALCAQLPLSGRLAAVAGNCALRATDCSEQEWRFVLTEQHAALLLKGHAGQLAQIINAHLGTDLQVCIECVDSEVELPQTPAQLKAQLKQDELHAATQRLAANPRVLDIQRRFDATLLPESVRAVSGVAP